MHAKSWLMDDCLAIMGSCNGTKNSRNDCFEMTVSTRSLLVTTELRKAFDALWAISAQLDLDTLPEPRTPRRSRSSSVSRSMYWTDRAAERREGGGAGFLRALPESPRAQMGSCDCGARGMRALPEPHSEPRMQDDGNVRGMRTRPDSSTVLSSRPRRSRSSEETSAVS